MKVQLLRSSATSAILSITVFSVLHAQEPTGLAAAARANPAFNWVIDSFPGFRVYTLAGTYAHTHRDSLFRRLPAAVDAARQMIGAPAVAGPIDVFFVQDRAQMQAVTGSSVTGFTHVTARAVFLVANADWRVFDRHELMHVVAGNAWGHDPRRNPWMIEGLAQAADGFCAGYTNETVASALAQKLGWLDLPTMLHRFREQDDLRAYLQAASFTAFLLRNAGTAAFRTLWAAEADTSTVVAAHSLAVWERRWRAGVPAATIPAPFMELIERDGCGIAPRSVR